MRECKDATIALNVRLKPSDSSAHPRAANYTNVGMAQGMAYLDFGFIEPALLAAIAKTAKDGQAAPKGLDGHLVTRIAMDVGAMARLHQQLQQVLVGVTISTATRAERISFRNGKSNTSWRHVKNDLKVDWED